MKLTTLIFVLISSLYFISCDKDVSVTPPETPAPRENKADFSVDFTANPSMHGSILCQSRPNHAEILLNGQPTQKYTPDTLKGLLPGDYNIVFKSLGCRNDSMRVVVKSGTLEKAEGKLQDTTVWLTYNRKNSGLPSDYLTCAAVDGKDVIWIGTVDRGLVSFDGGKWETYNTSNSALPSNNITSLAVHYVQQGSTLYQSIYIGTPEGLAIMVNKNITVFNKSNSPLPDNYVTSVSVDKWNYAWVGTQKGLMLLPGEWSRMKAYDLSSTMGENWVTCVAAAAPDFGSTKHQVFIGLLSNGLGVFNYTDNTWMHYFLPNNSLPNNELRSMGVMGWNDVYFGCAPTESMPSGMGHFSSNSFGLFWLGTDKNSYKSILTRMDGSIWICTTEGLFYKPSQFSPPKHYDGTNSKLPSNSLTGIAFDSGGKAWITTAYDGLVLYKPYMDK